MRGSHPDKLLVESYFVFACIWALGGTMMVDKTCDYRVLFSKWWIAEWKTIVFPNQVTTCPLQTFCSACDLLASTLLLQNK